VSNIFLPHVNTPSQITSIFRDNLPSLNLAESDMVDSGTFASKLGTASYIAGSLSESPLDLLGPYVSRDTLLLQTPSGRFAVSAGGIAADGQGQLH
jgi:hypothetical protein